MGRRKFLNISNINFLLISKMLCSHNVMFYVCKKKKEHDVDNNKIRNYGIMGNLI